MSDQPSTQDFSGMAKAFLLVATIIIAPLCLAYLFQHIDRKSVV